jgi:DNA-binding MarR family transcriptional regulator
MGRFKGGKFMNTARTHAQHGFSQFELTTKIVKNLNKYDITPTAKLVLILLTTHFNEEKNGSVVFPSMPYISETLGISLTATKQAIKDLVSEGLILQSKREKIRGNYNKYILTQKVQNSTVEQAENEPFKRAESDLSLIRTNKKNEIKEQTENRGVIVYSFQSNDSILEEYAIKHGARNIKAYVNTLKSSGSAAKIISDHKKQKKVTQMALASIQETQELIKNYNEMSLDSNAPCTSIAWKKFSEKAKLRV